MKSSRISHHLLWDIIQVFLLGLESQSSAIVADEHLPGIHCTQRDIFKLRAATRSKLIESSSPEIRALARALKEVWKLT